MKATLLNRATPLLITTMLVTAPAWAQSTSPQNTPGNAPGVTSSPGTAIAPVMPQPVAPSALNGAPSGTAPKAMPSPSRHASAPRQPGESMTSLVERRIADLHSKLHITPEQSQQWDPFAQAMRDNAQGIDQAYQQRAEKFSTMSAVENMQSYAQIEQERAADMQKLVPAFQTLYDTLSAPQKRTADQLFRNYAENAQARRTDQTSTAR